MEARAVLQQLPSCGTNAGSQLKLANGVDVGTANGGAGDQSLWVNGGFVSSQTSDFAIAEVLVWPRGLTDQEMRSVSQHLITVALRMAWAHRCFRSILWRRGQGTTKFGSRNAGAARRPLTRSLTAAPKTRGPKKLTPSSSALRTRAAVRRTRTLGYRIQVRARPITMRPILLTPSPFPKEETVSGWQAVISLASVQTSRLTSQRLFPPWEREKV